MWYFHANSCKEMKFLAKQSLYISRILHEIVLIVPFNFHVLHVLIVIVLVNGITEYLL